MSDSTSRQPAGVNLSQLGVQENVDLRHLNTFHVAAKARYFVRVCSTDRLREVLGWCRTAGLPFLLLGQGSNVLFQQDYPGLVIELQLLGRQVVADNAESVDVRVAAGEPWHDFVQYALQQQWYGLENLSLIPGTVGAAPVQNIGAYGVELKDFVVELEALEVASGAVQRFSAADCAFGYRQSFFKQAGKDRFVIVAVTLRLRKQQRLVLDYPGLRAALAAVASDDLTAQQVSDTVCQLRRSKLPDPGKLGNAGSFFWNPQVSANEFAALRERFPTLPGFPDGAGFKIPAAWLIEQTGWKGFREGDVGVHRDHALVLVNYGAATGAQLLALAERIQASVHERFGITLWPEVRIL